MVERPVCPALPPMVSGSGPGRGGGQAVVGRGSCRAWQNSSSRPGSKASRGVGAGPGGARTRDRGRGGDQLGTNGGATPPTGHHRPRWPELTARPQGARPGTTVDTPDEMPANPHARVSNLSSEDQLCEGNDHLNSSGGSRLTPWTARLSQRVANRLLMTLCSKDTSGYGGSRAPESRPVAISFRCHV